MYQARCRCDRIVELNIVNLTLSTNQVKLVIMSATLQAGRVGGELMKDEGGEKDVCCHCHAMFFFLPAVVTVLFRFVSLRFFLCMVA